MNKPILKKKKKIIYLHTLDIYLKKSKATNFPINITIIIAVVAPLLQSGSFNGKILLQMLQKIIKYIVL